MPSGRYHLPSISTLLAFEATARLSSVTRAAEELRTSHSAVSRHIRLLEKTYGVTLFERRGRGVVLTSGGQSYFLAVQSCMDTLQSASLGLLDERTDLTIGCTLEICTLVLEPIFPALKRALGDAVAARIVVYDFDLLPLLVQSGLDIVFEGLDGKHPDPGAVPVLCEEIVPIVSPAFAQRYASELSGHPRSWGGVPRLDIGRRSPGWATWETWFDAHHCKAPPAPVETFENYFHLLRAASDGDGLAIGWNAFVSEHLRQGSFVAVRPKWLPTKLTMYGVPTPDGSRKPIVQKCLKTLSNLVEGLCTESPVTADR